MEYSEADATFTVEIEGGVPNYYYEWYVLKDSDETKVTHGATSDAREMFLYRTVTFTKKQIITILRADIFLHQAERTAVAEEACKGKY